MDQITHLNCSAYYQPVMEPLSDAAPCGGNLDYDPAFIMLQSQLQPKLGVEYGNFVEAAEPVNWTEVERECQTLLQKSKDVRLIIILMRCRLRKVGLPALAEGTEVLNALLQKWPDDLHPQLLDEGEFAPILRANAFAELEDINGLLSDLRGQVLPKASGLQITVKEFEKAHQIPREEGALTDAAVAALVHEWHTHARDEIRPLTLSCHFIQEIRKTLSATLGHEAPEFTVLSNILNMFSREFGNETPDVGAHPETVSQAAAEQTISESTQNITAAEAVIPPSVPIAVPSAAAPVPGPREGVTTRTDALQRLQEVRSWFAMTEPSSPLVLLLRYAEESIGKNFAELLKMYPPEIVAILNQEKE